MRLTALLVSAELKLSVATSGKSPSPKGGEPEWVARPQSRSSGCKRQDVGTMPGPAMSPLDLTRSQILAFRRRVGALDERLPAGARSLRRAAWAGLQDSMPRAALLSIHARVEGAHPSSWEDSSLAQLWGLRYQVYVVAKQDFALFSLGRYPDDHKGRLRAEQTAELVHGH